MKGGMIMQKVWIIFALLLSFVFFSNIYAQSDEIIEVPEMVFCTGVEDRVPVGADTMFLNTVEQVYCFTKITGVSETATISHVWYYDDNEMARVDLTVSGDSWRTWSSKRIIEDWGGAWRVDVVTESGEILKSMGFTIQAVSE
jgi:hypothetical protein